MGKHHLFSGDSSEDSWDDWLPTFKVAAEWNGWSDPECLLQLSGFLRGKAQQEPFSHEGPYHLRIRIVGCETGTALVEHFNEVMGQVTDD